MQVEHIIDRAKDKFSIPDWEAYVDVFIDDCI